MEPKCRPSCEGRGLKRNVLGSLVIIDVSPLMRGAWIETKLDPLDPRSLNVAPHARGVD